MKQSILPIFAAFLLCFCLPQNATAQHNPSLEDYMTRANELMDDGQLEEAIPYLNYILMQKENHIDARFNRAICQYELENHNSAIFDLNYAINQNPKDLEFYELRAMAYDEIGQYDHALADFSEVLEHKRTSSTLVNRGSANLKAGNYMPSLKDFEAAIRMQPSNSQAYAGLGEVYFALKRYQEAINNFDIAIQLNATDAFLYNNRGDAKMRLANADLGGAYYDFYKALELGQEPIFYSNLAHLFIKMGDWDQAKRAAIAAMEINDNHAEAYFVVAILETEWGVYHQAVNSLDIAIELDPSSPTYTNCMANTHYELGNYFEAVEYYTTTQKLDRDFPGVNGNIAKAFGAFNASMESTVAEKGVSTFTSKGVPTEYEVNVIEAAVIEYEVDNLRMLRVKNYEATEARPTRTTPKTTEHNTIEEDMFGEGF